MFCIEKNILPVRLWYAIDYIDFRDTKCNDMDISNLMENGNSLAGNLDPSFLQGMNG